MTVTNNVRSNIRASRAAPKARFDSPEMKSMKSKIIILIVIPVLFKSLNVSALVLGPFPGWDRMEKMSSNIAVVACYQPLSSRPNYDDDVVGSDRQAHLYLSLKGTNWASNFRLLTNYPLLRGRKYLVFGYYVDGTFEAFEDYRVVPLSRDFDIKSVSGKSPDQQLQILFQDGIKEMDREIQNDEAEKQRMEEALRQ